MTKNRAPTLVYLDPGMHPGLEVKGLKYYAMQSQTEVSVLYEKELLLMFVCPQQFISLP